jgi:diaminopimelate epimerase
MGNPHAVLRVNDINNAPVHELGPKIEHHPRFPARVNVGFSRSSTVPARNCACGSVAPGNPGLRYRRLRRRRGRDQPGWMDSPLLIDLPGGRLSIEWAGPGHPVLMTGPAVRVYEGQVRL